MGEVEVIHGDCLEVMAGMPAGSVDAVVTDPPYNVGLDYTSYGDNRSDYDGWCRAWLAELKRVCRGPIAISVGQANLSRWAAIEPPTWWLAWWKPAAMGRCVVGFNNWEPIALYGKAAREICDVIRAGIRPDKSLGDHPCPKPLDWAIRQIEMLTDPEDIVLDPFLGSGTTALACLKTGRRCIGIDIDDGYCSMARRRLDGPAMPLFARLADAATPLFSEV